MLKTGVLRALAPVLASEAVRKVMHDCREDASSFYHQYGIRLRNVFDTQAGLESFKRSLTRAREPLHIFVNNYAFLSMRVWILFHPSGQVAARLALERAQRKPYLLSLQDLLRTRLQTENAATAGVRRKLQADPNLWSRRAAGQADRSC